MKIRPVGAELFLRTDGRTAITKLIVAFLNSANATKTSAFFLAHFIHIISFILGVNCDYFPKQHSLLILFCRDKIRSL